MGVLLLGSCVECWGQSASCTRTVENATVIIPDSAAIKGAAFFEADSVAVFTAENTCVGGGRWSDSDGTAIAVMGNGPFGDEGLDDEEPFRFRLYNARGEQRQGGSGTFAECERLGRGVQAFCRDDGRYENDAIYVLQTIRLGPSSSDEKEVRRLKLSAPHPNPTRGQVSVRFATPERQWVSLKVYDALGRAVQTLGRGKLEGHQMVQADLSGLASGTYFLRLRSKGKTKTQRITVVR